MNDPDQPTIVFTLEEAAEILRLKALGYADPVKTLRRWVIRRKIPHTRIGRNIAFVQENIDEFLKSCRKGPTVPPPSTVPLHAQTEVELAPGTLKYRPSSRARLRKRSDA